MTKLRIWWISRKKNMTLFDLVFLVRAAEEGYSIPKMNKVKLLVDAINRGVPIKVGPIE